MKNTKMQAAATGPRRTMLSHAMVAALGASLLAFAPVVAAQQTPAREFALEGVEGGAVRHGRRLKQMPGRVQPKSPN